MDDHVTTKRRRGQQPLDVESPSASLHVRLPVKEFDALFKRAELLGVSMAEQARYEMRRGADKDKG